MGKKKIVVPKPKRKRRRNVSQKRGLPPGSLVHVGEKRDSEVLINGYRYNEDVFEEIAAFSNEMPKQGFQLWLNIDGLHDISKIEEIGKHFSLDNLMLEDIVNTDQRPKVEDFDEHIFLTCRMAKIVDGEIDFEMVSFVLGDAYLLSFQEEKGDVFDSVRNRIENRIGKIRHSKIDYLLFALVDVIVDHYFSVLEHFRDTLDYYEENVLLQTSDSFVDEIQRLRRELLSARRNINPLKEMIFRIQKLENPLIDKLNAKYWRDVYDHMLSITESIENYRETLNSINDTYMVNISNRMNKIMQLLAVVSAIFIPLTFIAGVYGMNFHRMPELQYPWAYPIVIGIMVFIAVILLIFFNRKGWLDIFSKK